MLSLNQLLVLCVICSQAISALCKPQGPAYNKEQSSSSSQLPAVKSSDDKVAVSVGKTSGFELKHGYSFNMASKDGTPYASGFTYLGGHAGPGPSYLTEDRGFLPEKLWNRQMVEATSTGLYTVAAAVALGTLYYTFSPFIFGTRSAPVKKKAGGASPTDMTKKSDDPASKPITEQGSETKTRRRREAPKTSTAQTDAELTRLASIVLNAIASGECLHKTICQVGTQVGQSPKGRLAFSLVDNLLPASVHANQYFITMKKALKGESICEKFNCQYPTFSGKQ